MNRPDTSSAGYRRNRDDLLDSWKEIAAHLSRTVRTVQRWERNEDLPVHRHLHEKRSTVYAYRSELDAWRHERGSLVNRAPGWSRARHRGLWAAAGLAAMGIAAVGVLGWPRLFGLGAPTAVEGLGFEERDWLLIANFDNRTGEEIFDGTLAAAIRRELANSSFFKVASPERVGDTLRLMRRPADTPLDAHLAREVALRDGGIRAVLTGRVERLGTAYVLSAELLDPAEGQILFSLSNEAKGQEAILPAVSELSLRVRESLGEALPMIEGSGETLSRVSTPSLRALRLYSRADQLMAMEGHEAAEELLREAIAQDPDFASSYTHLAWALRNQNRPPKELLPYAEKAFELSERATVAERYFIRGSYYQMRSFSTQKNEDAEAALAQYQALLQLDPGHFWASVTTPEVLRSLGRGGETLELFLQLVEARPNDLRIVALTARELVVAGGDLESARRYVERARRLQEQGASEAGYLSAFLQFFPVHELWVRGEADRLVREVDSIVDSLVERTAAEREHLAFEAFGYYLDLGMFGKAEDLQTLHGLYSPEGWETLMAWRRRDRERLRELPGGPSEDMDVGRISSRAFNLSILGFLEEADQFLGRLPPGHGLAAEGNALAAKGVLDFARNRHEEAISALEEAIAFLRQRQSLGNYFAAVGILSRAWEALGQPEKGLMALEAASRQKPRLQWGRAYWMELQLRLAELYREVGREHEALEIEDELRRYCAWANPDFLILQELEKRQRLVLAVRE